MGGASKWSTHMRRPRRRSIHCSQRGPHATTSRPPATRRPQKQGRRQGNDMSRDHEARPSTRA